MILLNKRSNGRALGFFGTFFILGTILIFFLLTSETSFGGTATGYAIGIALIIPSFPIGILVGHMNQRVAKKNINKKSDKQRRPTNGLQKKGSP